MVQALGIIEAIGMATAIEAADAACKSANVTLLGMEPCRGDGMYTIKILGDVGAVKAACQAAEAACSKGRGCFSAKVIARPSDGILPMIFNENTVGYQVDEDESSEDEESANSETDHEVE
ncbi:MAG: BMC domain-containing protein [Eubacteriaceae bacterium]|jgi:microcompartment protein CcmL/EutN|nr:BMC domain-containing protein [Eubacteriaceae bacterium]